MGSKQKAKEYTHIAPLLPILKQWWGEPFKKTPKSGGLRWGGEGGHWVYADLVPPPSFPFAVECKFHREFDLWEIMSKKDGYQGKLCYYWHYQCVPDAIRATEELGITIYPLMIVKQNKTANALGIQYNLFLCLPSEIVASLPHMVINIPNATPFVLVDFARFVGSVSRQLVEKRFLGR